MYLNPLWVGEDKWEIFAACIRLYQEAMTRLSPAMPPLRVPPRSRIFYVEKGNEIIWHGRKLILTVPLLDPKNSQRLLTELARALWDYNSSDLRLRLFLASYEGWSLFLSLFGIWMWIPSVVKRLLGWHNWRAERVLDADRFVWALGQGELLLHRLRQFHEDGKEEPDRRLPRSIERMGQLESLLKDEQRQMLALGLQPARPLVA